MYGYLPDKTEQLKTLENGMGVQYILDETNKILGNPLLAHDMECKLIAHNKDSVNDDPIRTQPSFKYAIYSNHIVILMSSDSENFHIKQDLQKLNRLFTQNNIYVGVGNCFQNPFELQKRYIEAINALKHGLKTNGSQRIFPYDGAEPNIFRQ